MRRALVIGLLGVALIPASATPAAAHNADTTTFGRFYRFRTQLNMYFQENTAWQTVPGLTDRVVDAMVSWNNLQPADNIHFGSLGFANMTESPTCANPVNVNGIFWHDASGYTGDPGTLGVTRLCTGVYSGDPNRIRSANIIFDSDIPNWSLNASWTPVSGYYDLWSVATHELGHTLGLFMGTTPGSNGVIAKHWEAPPPGLAQPGQVNGDTLCPPNSNRHTLCSVTLSGTTYQRDPAPHDQHTVYNKYGPGYP